VRRGGFAPPVLAPSVERVFGNGSIRVLGVDPGLTRCGVGVVEGKPGRPLKDIAHGVIRTPTTLDVAQRLLQLQTEITIWISNYRPDVVAVERVFAQHNVRTVMATAQAAAVAMTCAAANGVVVNWHTPSEVKAAVSGNGRADKDQVTAMVTRLLNLPTKPTPADAADALALAICEVWRGSARRRVQAAATAARAGRPAPKSRSQPLAVAR